MLLSAKKILRILLYIVLPLLLAFVYIIIILIAQRPNTPPTVKKHNTPQVIPVSPFVSRSGTTLIVKGSSLHLIGYNWTWLGTGCARPTDVEIDAIFSQIATVSHGNVIRTAFYQSGSNSGLYTDFDRYIQHAKHYGLYIVPILVNDLDNCEPAKIMSRSAWYQWGYTEPSDGYPLSFRTYALRLAAHYANESTIAFWQLVNEPDAHPCGAAGAQTLRNFADDMTIALKRVDPNHMVDLGVPGQCAGGTIADYMQIVSGQVELCDVWHDYKAPATPLPSQMSQRINSCQRLNKPSFVGESGMCAGITADQTCSWTIDHTTLQQRATFLAAKLEAGLSAGLAGYILWNKGDKSVEGDIGPDDPTESVMSQYGSAH
jgi:hypothetical protein